MTPEKKLQSLLLNDPATAALVGTRVRMDMAEESDDMPYLVMMRDETALMHTLGAAIDNPDVVFELHSWATTRLGAETLAGAVKAAAQSAGMSLLARESAYSREITAHCAVLKVVLD